jgi:hypothetical protein
MIRSDEFCCTLGVPRSFPSSAWEYTNRQALLRNIHRTNAKQSLAESAFPSRAWERESIFVAFYEFVAPF